MNIAPKEPMKQLLGDIVEAKIKAANLTSARSSIDQFNTSYSNALRYADPQTDDDIEHAKVRRSLIMTQGCSELR
ncbi:MAG: hypothetical protein Q9224_007097 [Gallowayella concinna]